MFVSGPFGQFTFQRKFRRFDFWPFEKSKHIFHETMGNAPSIVSLIFQNLNSISESILKICCERTSFFDIFLGKKFMSRFEVKDLKVKRNDTQNFLKCPMCSLHEAAQGSENSSYFFDRWCVTSASSALRESAFAPLASKQREEALQVENCVFRETEKHALDDFF